MANFEPSKKTADNFNGGVAYVNGDAVQAETINNLVESALYTQEVVEQNTTDLQEGIENVNESVNTQIQTLTTNVNNSIDTLTSTVNTGIQQAKNIADSAVDIANDALDQVQDALSGGVVGVKGNNETTYRTGQVNLTSANIGAMPTSGGTFTGNITAPKVTASTQGLYDGTNRAWSNGNRPTSESYVFAAVTNKSNQTDTVTGYYRNADGTSWYRQWSSGWKECGGILNSGTLGKTTDITFPIAFNFVPTITYAPYGANDANSQLRGGILLNSATASKFTFVGRQNADGYINGGCWRAEGY